MSAIPKRIAPTNEVDIELAKTLLGLVFDNNAPRKDGDNVLTASDGVAYAEQVKARSAANRAKRLVGHVKPDGFNTVTRVYQPEGAETWEWALWIETAKPVAAKA